MNFNEMYRRVHMLNRRVKEGKFQRVEVSTDFFKDLEKVLDEAAMKISRYYISWYYIMNDAEEDDG